MFSEGSPSVPRQPVEAENRHLRKSIANSDRDQCFADLQEAEGELTRYREALEWIRDHAQDEEALSERSVCADSFHITHRTGAGRCPACHSSWWASDGSLPGEEGSYALEAVADEALSSPTDSQEQDG